MAERKFEVVEVSALPWPHNPFKCGLRDDFSAFAPGWEECEAAEVQHAFHRFIRTRDPADFARCDYHGVDWARLAEDAIRFFAEAGGKPPRLQDVEDALELEGRAEEAGHVAAFFDYDAILWPGGPVIENGQHRVCAMKQQGARRCIVVRPEG